MLVKFVDFNADKQTVSCQPLIKTTMTDDGSINLSVLANVPVKFLRAGGFALTFPIKADDEGIVIINDRCIDGWYQSGELSDPLENRMHDLSDAVFLPGVSSLPNVISDFDQNAIVVKYCHHEMRSHRAKQRICIAARNDVRFLA